MDDAVLLTVSDDLLEPYQGPVVLKGERVVLLSRDPRDASAWLVVGATCKVRTVRGHPLQLDLANPHAFAHVLAAVARKLGLNPAGGAQLELTLGDGIVRLVEVYTPSGEEWLWHPYEAGAGDEVLPGLEGIDRNRPEEDLYPLVLRALYAKAFEGGA